MLCYAMLCHSVLLLSSALPHLIYYSTNHLISSHPPIVSSSLVPRPSSPRIPFFTHTTSQPRPRSRSSTPPPPRALVTQYTLFLLYASFVHSSRLEELLLTRCELSVHVAHSIYWFLKAFCVQGAGVTPVGVKAIEQVCMYSRLIEV